MGSPPEPCLTFSSTEALMVGSPKGWLIITRESERFTRASSAPSGRVREIAMWWSLRPAWSILHGGRPAAVCVISFAAATAHRLATTQGCVFQLHPLIEYREQLDVEGRGNPIIGAAEVKHRKAISGLVNVSSPRLGSKSVNLLLRSRVQQDRAGGVCLKSDSNPTGKVGNTRFRLGSMAERSHHDPTPLKDAVVFKEELEDFRGCARRKDGLDAVV